MQSVTDMVDGEKLNYTKRKYDVYAPPGTSARNILKRLKSLQVTPHYGVIAPVSGRVVNVSFRKGMKVRKGQTLFILEGTAQEEGAASSSQPPNESSFWSEKRHARAVEMARETLVRFRNTRTGVFRMEDVLLHPQDDITSCPLAGLGNEEVQNRFKSFKKFDVLSDHTGHRFSTLNPLMNQPEGWADRIKQEWTILERDLPDTISVRVFNPNMDLLSAVIVGPKGTPYHDGLYFFDVLIPRSYPESPPVLWYNSGGLGINPNLFTNGGVELALPKVNGQGLEMDEMWVPGTSSLLKLLVSIQDKFFHSNPLRNDVAHARCDSVFTQQSCLFYNENTLLKSLKTMVYIMNKPPKNFEDFVVGHFRSRVRDILIACEAYIDGMQVGCFGVQPDEEDGNKVPCTIEFKNDVATYIKPLVTAFEKIGASEAKEFLYLSDESIQNFFKCRTERQSVTDMVDGEKLYYTKSKYDDYAPPGTSAHDVLKRKVYAPGGTSARDTLKRLKRTAYYGRMTVIAPVSGQVFDVLINEGMQATKGQTLFLLEPGKIEEGGASITKQLKESYYSIENIRARAESFCSIENIRARDAEAGWKRLVQLRNSHKGVFVMEDVLVDHQEDTSCSLARLDNEEVQKRFKSFKKFDILSDYTGHRFSTFNPLMNQPEGWADRIKQEWTILEKDLPDTIFVRVFNPRMDLLSAVIVGPKGTPYHDGLYFFDVFIPRSYPESPPLLWYHSGGLGINPNLFYNGGVELTLPKINGQDFEVDKMWVPGSSNMLKLLVSVKDQFFNPNPFRNDVTYARYDSVYARHSCLLYNENTLLKSLKTMVYVMNKQPKNFEDFVVGHFRSRVGDILMACQAYTEGTQVGCFGVQLDEEEGNNKVPCTVEFKNDVATYIKPLVAAFEKIGASEAKEFLHLSDRVTPVP